MITKAKTALRRFVRGEEGSMVVPLALWTPVFMGLIVASVELGTVTIRHAALERAMDETIRSVRIGTGATDHAGIKQDICDSAAVLPDCANMLKLEMIRLDLRNWAAPPETADCVDVSEPFAPSRTFQTGGSNDLMYLRACYKYQPISPAGTLGATLAKDVHGYAALTAKSAFALEPQGGE